MTHTKETLESASQHLVSAQDFIARAQAKLEPDPCPHLFVTNIHNGKGDCTKCGQPMHYDPANLRYVPTAPASSDSSMEWRLPALPAGMEYHRTDWTQDMLPDGWRPLLWGEVDPDGEYLSSIDQKWRRIVDKDSARATSLHSRTRRPLPAVEAAEQPCVPYTRETCPPLPCEVTEKVTGDRYAVVNAYVGGTRLIGMREGWVTWQVLLSDYTHHNGAPCGTPAKPDGK